MLKARIYIKKDAILSVLLEDADNLEYVFLGEKNRLIEREVAIFFENYSKGISTPLPPLHFETLPPFTKKVLQFLHDIPFGVRKTYAEVAQGVGCPKGPRAVGQVCRRNPFPFFIPCHRVVAAHDLGGFSQGLHVKERLLNFENRS